jgi:anti-anti-sigma factor
MLFETNAREELERYGREIEALAAPLGAGVGYRAFVTASGWYEGTIYTWSPALAEAWRRRLVRATGAPGEAGPRTGRPATEPHEGDTIPGLQTDAAAVHEGARELRLSERLDGSSTRQLEEAVRAELAYEPRELVLDLSGLTYLDAAGVAALIDARINAAAAGVLLRAVGLRGQPAALAASTGLADLLLQPES